MTGQYMLCCPVAITGEKEMKIHGYTILGGFCMALADSVPGVSGGTIAFLMGFYDALVGSLDALVHGTKQERLHGLRYLLKLAVGWVVGMALAVTVLAGAFTDGIYQLSSLFLGFVFVSVPLVMREQRAVLGTFRQNWLPFLAGIVLVVGLSALRLSALVNDLGFSVGTALYAFAVGALAISAMVLPGISGSSLLMSCGLYLPVIAAMKDALHFQFGQFWLLAAVGVGALVGFAVAPHWIRRWMRKAPGAVTYAVLGMMLGSLYAIVVGPTTLKVPQHVMTLSDFHVLWFALGIAVMLGLEALKKRVEKV